MANLTLFEKLAQIESRYDEMTRELSSPEIHGDSARYQKLAKQHSELGRAGRERAEQALNWEVQKGKLVAAFAQLSANPTKVTAD